MGITDKQGIEIQPCMQKSGGSPIKDPPLGLSCDTPFTEWINNKFRFTDDIVPINET